jgi:hypothetical protein
MNALGDGLIENHFLAFLVDLEVQGQVNEPFKSHGNVAEQLDNVQGL